MHGATIKKLSFLFLPHKDKVVRVMDAAQTFVANCTFLLGGLDPISTVTHSVSLSRK